MMIFACLVVVSLMICNDFSRQGRLVAWRGRGLRGSVSEVWTAGHGGVKGRGRGRANLSLWALCVLLICVLCEKKNVFEIRWGVFSLTELTDLTEPFYAKFNSWGVFFSHRTHRFNRTYLRTVSNSQNASGIQISQNVTAKDGCKVLWNRLT